jgi:CDP-2,3-bis-(O-geranylgeranyl)-sn-glycerol synthase
MPAAMDRPDPVACALFLTLAFVLAGLLQSLWLRSRRSARFRVPLDGGRSLAGKRIFGDNKTWRGVVVMVPAVGAAFALFRLLGALLPGGWPAGLWYLSPAEYAGLGCWTGLGFMAGELPNSFCKRRLGIGPGAAPAHPVGKVVCFVCDRLDSLAGAFLALALVVPTHPGTLLYVLLVGPAVHWSFSVLLFRLGVKARPA